MSVRRVLSCRRWIGLASATLAAAALSATLTAPAYATPPNIPSMSTAQAELDALTVADEGSMSGYSRNLFPHWITISSTCNTREMVLMRDGTDVVVGGDCYPDSGSWYTGIAPTMAPRSIWRPALTSTTWCRSPRRGAPEPTVGVPVRGKPSPTTWTTRN